MPGCGKAGRGRATDRADRFGRAVPRPRSRAAGRRDPGAGDLPSQVVDGAEDLGQHGHADEQEPGGDRGTPKSDKRRVRKEGVSTCRSRWSPTTKNKPKNKNRGSN